MAISRIDSMSGDDAVRRATGRGSEEWFALLDDAGAPTWGHTAIAKWLLDVQGITGWWAQNVAVRYEQARGLRLPGQQADGTFSASASRAAQQDIIAAFDAIVAAAGAEFASEPRTYRDSGTRPIARWNLPDGGSALVTADPAKGDRVRVTVMFEKLPTSAATTTAKERAARILDAGLPEV